MRATITKYPIEIKIDTDFEDESDSNFNFKEFSMASFSESTISPLEIILTPDRTIPLERLIWDKLNKIIGHKTSVLSSIRGDSCCG